MEFLPLTGNPHCSILHVLVVAAHLRPVLIFFRLYFIRQARRDSDDAGKIFQTAYFNMHVLVANRTLHMFISVCVVNLLGSWYFYTHTHTHLVADICLLPVVFQRVQLDVLWSMLC